MKDAERFLLSLFLKPRQLETITGPGWSEVWCQALGRQPSVVLGEFLASGLIEPGTPAQLLDVKYRVPELQQMCRSKGIPDKGVKAELVERLARELPEAELLRATSGVRAFICTAIGSGIGEEHKARTDEDRRHTEASVLEALRKRRFEEACRLVHAFEARQPIPRGIGVDWIHGDWTREVEQLRYLLGQPAGSGNADSGAANEDLNMAAAMGLLWGTGPDKWLRKKATGDVKPKRRRRTAEEIEAEKGARMAMFAAHHKAELKQYRANRDVIRGVSILAAGDSCEYCRTHTGNFSLDRVPELPHAKCTHEKGCRCCYTAIVR